MPQLEELKESFQAGPEYEHRNVLEIVKDLMADSVAFDVAGKGTMMVRIKEQNGVKCLVVEAFTSKGANVKSWVAALKRLAADWSCHRIETLIYQKRLARAIVLCGAKPEAVVLTLRVGD